MTMISPKGNDNSVNLMILGQGPAITLDTGLEPEQVCVTEARNALLSQDQQALSDLRWDYSAILVMIIEEAKVQDIL